MADSIASPTQLKSLFTAADQADAELARLRAVRGRLPAGSALATEVDERIRQGEALKARYASTLYQARDLWNWLTQAAGGASASIGDAWTGLKKTLGLGVLPALPIIIGGAAISAALVGITGFVTDAINTNKRVGAWERAVAQGIDPNTAANALASGSTEGFGTRLADNLGTLAKWAALIYGGWKLAQYMGWVPKK